MKIRMRFVIAGLVILPLLVMASGCMETSVTPTACGGENADACPEDQFCKREVGACSADGAEGVCTAIPDVCIEIFQPVCGCDGQTYANECMAGAAGVNIEGDGACGQPNCCNSAEEPGTGDNPTCFEGASCCSDGMWQCNSGDGSSICETPGEVCDAGGAVCGGIAGLPCGENELCLLPQGNCCCDFQGVCTPIPDVCTEGIDPVCGCDGNTYGNPCEARAAGVNIESIGECP